jgi:dipeptidyl-peptidase-4
VSLEAALLLPADFDPSRRYPVLMYTYGGPGSQVVMDTYGSRSGLEQYLSEQGFVLAMVDGRGAGGRGRDFKKSTYLNLGQYEVEDQIAGARWLASLPFVDASRIGIWGWSYGGYMTSLCILRGAELFRAAVAVAPVTHWKYYDTIYTERYMRRPQDNPEGYERSSPMTYAEKLTGRYLLMHGLADDNVHFQNAADLAAVYQKGGTPFEMMVYPGKHHGLEGVGLHWATMLCEFFCRTIL